MTRRGFTLIELLIASAAFALAAAGFMAILTTTTRVGSRQSSTNEVETQGQFLLQQFQYYIQTARLVDMSLDASSTVLRLRESNAANDPTQISLASGVVNLQQGLTGALQPLTSNKVSVSNLLFTRHYNLNGSSTAYGTDSVSYSFTMAASTTNATMYYSQNFQSAAAVLAPVPWVALIQQVSTTTANTGITSIQVAYPSTNESSSLLIAVVSNISSTSAGITVADTAGNTWTKIANPVFSTANQQMAIFYAPNSKSSANTVTASFTVAVTNPSLYLYEYRGAATTMPFDASSTQTQTNVTAFSSGSASPTSTVELAFGVLYLNPLPASSPVVGSGFTMEASSSVSNSFIEDQNIYVTGPVSAGWTAGSAASSSAIVVTFRSGGIGGGGGGGGGGSGHIANGMMASYVLGQQDFVSHVGTTTQNGFLQPYSTAYDSANQRLFVVDYHNYRITIFNVAPGTIANGMNASYVLGEPDFVTSVQTTTQTGLYGPSGDSAYDSVNQRLFVADNVGSRVLVYNVAPGTIANGMNASYVLGQVDFTHNNGNPNTQAGFCHPSSVAYDSANSRLFAADSCSHRVLVFNVAPGTIANNMNASYVLGQPDFVTIGPTTTQSGFNGPQGLTYDSSNQRLFVTEQNNYRVTVFNVAPGTIANGMNASYVIGQADFTHRVAGLGTQNGLYYPYGTAYDSANGRLFVADYYNKRVTVYNAAPGTIANGMSPSYVIGQADFTSFVATTTQSGFKAPYGATYDSTNGRLFVADYTNDRVMVFNVAP